MNPDYISLIAGVKSNLRIGKTQIIFKISFKKLSAKLIKYCNVISR